MQHCKSTIVQFKKIKENYIQYHVLDHNGKNHVKNIYLYIYIYLYKTKQLCSTCETGKIIDQLYLD